MATLLLDRYYAPVIHDHIKFWMLDEVKDAPYFHSFDWLRDLKSIGDSRSRRFARALILSWIKSHSKIAQPAWAPGIAGERLSNFLFYYEFFAQSAEDHFLTVFHKVLMSHLRYVRFYGLNLPMTYEAFLALKGATIATLAFQRTEAAIAPLLSRLTKVLSHILYSDGFYQKEHPDIQVRLARHLIDLRNFLRQCQDPGAALKIQQFIDRVVPPIRLLRHGDGRLSNLCGLSSISSSMIDVVLSLSDAKSRLMQKSEHAGFERLSIDNNLILLKTKPTTPLSGSTGNLQFEWSLGKDRILTVCDTILEDNQGKPLTSSKIPAVHKRTEDDHRFIEAFLQDDGYKHNREIYVGLNNDVRVCDRLSTENPAFGALRLIIHSDFAIQTSPDHTQVRLHHPRGNTFYLTFKNIEELSIDTKSTAFGTNTSLFALFRLIPGVEREISWAAYREF